MASEHVALLSHGWDGQVVDSVDSDWFPVLQKPKVLAREKDGQVV